LEPNIVAGTSQHLMMLGVDFTQAPLEIREALSYSDEGVARLLQQIGSVPALREAAVVSTCNRTEFYLVADDPAVASRWLDVVRADRPGTPVHDATCRLVRSSDGDAARHLFRVACGLESLLLGDAHIAGQLRRACACAAAAGSLGPVLSETFRHATEVMRRAQAATHISRGVASLGAAVAELVAAHGEAAGRTPTVLILGAGTVARECANYLAKRSKGPLVIANRTDARAVSLARACGGTAVAWTALAGALANVDVVVAAMASDARVLTREMFAALATPPPLVIDLGVPRNADPAVTARVVTIDEIALRRDESLDRRRAAIPAVERLIAEQLLAWRQWHLAQPREALLKELFLDEARRRRTISDELARTLQVDASNLDAALKMLTAPLLQAHARALRQLPIGSAFTPYEVARLNGSESPKENA
jgi:glutamyl-tRNA reductase